MRCRFIAILIFLSFMMLVGSGCSVPCKLNPSNAPELRGFRLGMTLDEIKRKYPKLPPISANEYGLSKLYFDRTPKPQQSYNEFNFINADFYDELKGTRRVYLELVDNQIAAIKVVYTDEIPWKSDEEFIRKTAESLNIEGTWSNNDGYRSLQCADSLFFHAGIGRDLSHIPSADDKRQPYIEMFNVWAQMQPDLKRMKKDEAANKQKEAQKNAFTP